MEYRQVPVVRKDLLPEGRSRFQSNFGIYLQYCMASNPGRLIVVHTDMDNI
jgi:hypothetical protein